MGGVAFADEDILQFNGTSWSLFFDGSDVGVGSSDLFAFSLMDADTILMAFSTAFTVNNISVTPQDILRFDATSLGSLTAGTFSLYFDGSDVGLESNSETIDSLTLLPDGRLLISTNGNPSVSGLTGTADEDVLAFTPITLGSVTSGTWAFYFDGSDVGLSDSNDEDIDGLDVTANGIYLSTLGNFAVNGVSGADEDVFLCVPASIGEATVCTYTSTLYFDGSAFGLSSNDVDGLNLPLSGAVPTPTSTAIVTQTPTATVGPTNTPTATATGGPTSTVTATATLARTPTVTPTFISSISTFTAIADSYVDANSPTTNYGSLSTLRADGSPVVRSYLRFNVQGLNGTVTKATLRIFANSSQSLGIDARGVTNNTWTESTINSNNAPDAGSVLGSSGAVSANTWKTMDVTSFITGNGVFNLAVTTNSNTAISLASRESGVNAPQLIIETGGGPVPTATFTATSTGAPTATQTPTFTATPTSIGTSTHTPTATASVTATPTQLATSTPTPTSGPSPTPTPTQTATGNLFTFNPVADSYVNAGSATTNYGTSTQLRVDGSPIVRSYLRFNVQGLGGNITRATLRILANSASSSNLSLSAVSNNTWTETGINYNNAPPLESPLGSSGPVVAGAWISIDVTVFITGNGSYNLALTTPGGTAISLASRESGASAPQLIIEIGP